MSRGGRRRGEEGYETAFRQITEILVLTNWFNTELNGKVNAGGIKNAPKRAKAHPFNGQPIKLIADRRMYFSKMSSAFTNAFFDKFMLPADKYGYAIPIEMPLNIATVHSRHTRMIKISQ